MLLAEIEATYGVTVLDYMDREISIPVETGMQRQGDVLVNPRPVQETTGTPIPDGGVAVVRGENGGNTHLLLGDGTFDPVNSGLALGLLTVPEDGVAVLAHPEHGFSRIGAGSYMVSRQREQADEIRMVAD